MQSDCSDTKLNNFIKSLGFNEFSQELVQIAFTHSSYTKENNLSYNKCYERLEFLGDAVLKMVITDYLYNKFPDSHEGELTKIRAVAVSDEILHKIALKLNIEPYIKVSEAEEKCGGKKLESIQACVMEALFGALYLSSNKITLKNYNAKAILQEYTQSKNKDLPEYELVKTTGAAHNRTFTIKVTYHGEELATASGKTKKQAQQEAAFIACQKLGIINTEGTLNE